MGLGTKIKNALHADDRRSPKGSDGYRDGRLPGAFPSETEHTKQGQYTDGRDFAVQDPSSTVRTTDAAGANHNISGVNRHSTLHKSTRQHQKSDSGIDFGDGPGFDKHHHGGMRADDYDERPVSEVSYGSAGDTPLEQPQPVKPAGLGRNNHQDPYWGDIDGRRGNGGTVANDYDKHLPIRAANQEGVGRDVYGRGIGGNNNSLNNGHNVTNLDTANDPYWSNKDTGATTNGTYNYNGYATGAYNGVSAAGGQNYQMGNGLRGNETRDVNGRGLNGRDLEGRDLNDRGLDAGDRGLGLTGAGIAQADSDDSRIRDRDMGRDRTGPHVAGVTGIGASEAARRHHEADMKEAGYHSNSPSAGNGNYDHHSHDGIGNGTGGRAAYGRSAGATPPRQSQQQKPQSSPVTHYVPRVLHTCTSCGADNDISQYFKPDVTYRLSQ